MSTRSVVVVGSCNVDLVATAPRHPQPGETILGDTLRTFPGGKGANQALAAARAGVPVHLIGRVGPDAGAQLLRDSLTADGVDLTWLGTCKHDPTGTALIVVSSAGENTIVVVPGANGLLRDVHVGDAVDAGILGDAGALLVQLEIPMPAVARACRAARDAGVTVICNAAPAAVLPPEVLSDVDVLVVNEHELGIVTGTTGSGVEAGIRAALEVVPAVVLTLGSRGALLATDHERVEVAAHSVDVVDTTAAGDAFCGTFAAAIASGTTVADALRRANAAGAIACTAEGAQPSLPTAAQVDELLTRQG